MALRLRDWRSSVSMVVTTVPWVPNLKIQVFDLNTRA